MKIEDLKVLYSREYIGRIIFVIKYKDKITFVYKSSGFSRTGHGGEIIPFMYLNTRKTVRGPMFGYIWKEYFKGNKYRPHEKDFCNKDKMFLDAIKELVKEYKVTQTIEEMNKLLESDDFIDLVNEINSHLRTYEHEYGLLDYDLI